MLKEGSLGYFSKILSDTKNSNILLPDGSLNKEKEEKFFKIYDKVSQTLNLTRLEGTTTVETLVAGLYHAMERSSEPVENYKLPIAMTLSLAMKIFSTYPSHKTKGGIYEDIERGCDGHISLGGHINDAFWHSPDYAIIEKIISNLDDNHGMPANEYVKKFGKVGVRDIDNYIKEHAWTKNALPIRNILKGSLEYKKSKNYSNFIIRCADKIDFLNIIENSNLLKKKSLEFHVNEETSTINIISKELNY